MCAACEKQRRTSGDPDGRCSRCEPLGEWATVIAMIQDRLASATVTAEQPVALESDVAADPFSRL